MIVITSGKTYIDIDAYASMIAYRELLRSLGDSDVVAISSAKLNQSVPPLIQNLRYQLDKTFISPDAKYIILDTSNPDFFDGAISEQNILEIIDHHTGFEGYWQTRGVKAEIEFIGSVCTIIFEKIIAAGKQDILTPGLCRLLIAGILDNTLDLRASITTERDIAAYNQLKSLSNLPDSWRKTYFDACDTEKAKDYKTAILDDLKAEQVSPLLPSAFGQMILQDPNKINYGIIASAFVGHDAWLMNIISLADGKSYLYFSGEGVKENLEKLFDTPTTNDYLIVLDQFLLRKQIMKLAREV